MNMIGLENKTLIREYIKNGTDFDVGEAYIHWIKNVYIKFSSHTIEDFLEKFIDVYTEDGSIISAPYPDVMMRWEKQCSPVAPPDDPTNPKHYIGKNGMESIDIIEEFDLGFCTGNAIKYILRHQKKEDPITDLRKAIWYLNRQIKILEAKLEDTE